ncbi:unnamed protein product, partial [Prorocentrum cordatum]
GRGRGGRGRCAARRPRRGAGPRVGADQGGRASALKSGLLLTVSAQLAANPFAKVVELIEGLLARLKAEAASEADHKAYCDEELKSNEKRRNKHQAAVARLTAEVQEKSVGLDDMAEDPDQDPGRGAGRPGTGHGPG